MCAAKTRLWSFWYQKGQAGITVTIPPFFWYDTNFENNMADF